MNDNYFNNPETVTPPADEQPTVVVASEETTEETVNEETEVSPKRKRRVPRIPKQIDDVITTAEFVLQKWQASLLVLAWKDKTDFADEIALLRGFHNTKINSVANRKKLTNELRALNKEIESHTVKVKGYLIDEFGRNGSYVHYASFGFERRKGRYSLPTDRDKRLTALQTMVAGMTSYNYQNKRYGLSYWQMVLANYRRLIDNTRTHDSDTSSFVASKNTLLEEVCLTLKAIYKLLEANYPKNYLAVAREWGFHKEKY